MHKRLVLMLAVATTACANLSWANTNTPGCSNSESVRIEEAEGIFPPASVQVPGKDINSPAAHLEWTYLGETDNKLTAHCYTKLLDAKPASSVDITGSKSCTFNGNALTLTCSKSK